MVKMLHLFALFCPFPIEKYAIEIKIDVLFKYFCFAIVIPYYFGVDSDSGLS